MDAFEKFKIKDYQHWTVYVRGDSQCFLGHCVIWCRREDALDLVETSKEEQKEFFEVLKDLHCAIQKAFAPDSFNYAFLGNRTKHLHAQIIPRYSSERQFEGVTFVDKRWGQNYLIDEMFDVSEEVILKIKDKIVENL